MLVLILLFAVYYYVHRAYMSDTCSIKIYLYLLISAPSLGVYYCQQLTLSICPDVPLSGCQSVCHKVQIASSFLFPDGIETFLAVSSPRPPLQKYFLRFLI